MKEIKEIIEAYEQATNVGKQTALATVVHVEGSSYRRPGARMLVADDGQLTGAISGGCLEGDALRKALLAINQQQAKLVTYDTTDEDDAKFGVQLGCNGIVHILFEPIVDGHNPIELLKRLTEKRKDAVLITLFAMKAANQPGTVALYRKEEKVSLLPALLSKQMQADAHESLAMRSSFTKNYFVEEAGLTAFIEFVPPPVSVVIAGAGNDVQPLVEMTSLLGWQTIVVDGRGTHATPARFPKADKVLVAKPADVLSQISTDKQTVFLLLTHNYNYDLALLKALLDKDCAYIGILGPKKKTDRMFDDLRTEGMAVNNEQRSRIYSPVGLDIGAETAEEIAVSIVAEIKSVLSAGSGASLKQKESSIHNRPMQIAKAS